MNKIIKLFILLILSLTTIIISKLTTKNITYLSLGDGYSKGINSYGIIDYGYSDYLKDNILKKKKLKYYTKELSKKDILINDLILDISEKQIKENNISIKQLLRETDIITLSIGLNDLKYELELTNNPNQEQINQVVNKVYKKYLKLKNEINKYYKNKIYLIGYPEKNIKDYNLLIAIKKLNNKYKEDKEIIYVDTSKIINNKIYWSNPNSIYPNIKGYKQIATYINNLANYKKTIEK